MTRRVWLLLSILAAGVFRASADDVVFRSDVALARVDAQVLDRDNRAVTGLTAADFVLREDGKVQPIRNFASENMPVDFLLLLDVSASMRPHVERIASAAHQALRVLGDQDRVAIMVFDRATRVRLPFRSNREDVEREFEALLRQESFRGGTDITHALLDAADYIGRQGRRDARRAIVILTDDQTEFNRDEEAVSRALVRADAVLSALLAPDAMGTGPGGGGHGGGWPGGVGGGMGGPLGGIILGRRGPYGGYPGGRGRMGRPHTQSAGTAEIAQNSGGDSMPVGDAAALETTLARLRQRYALFFLLPEGGRGGDARGIQVDLADAARRRFPDAQVRYRRVYQAQGDGATSASPVMVTRAPLSPPPATSEAASDAPVEGRRRRTAVDEPNGPRGPLIPAAGANPADPPAASTAQPAPAPAPAPAAAPAGGAASNGQQGGWRRLKPGEQP